MRVALAMLFYFGLVFGVGFLLGPIRALWLEPRFGPIIATACEAPFMLLAILVAARWVPRVLNIQRDSKALVLIGWLFGFAANCGFHRRLLVAGHHPKRAICAAADLAREHLRRLAGLVCNHAGRWRMSNFGRNADFAGFERTLVSKYGPSARYTEW